MKNKSKQYESVFKNYPDVVNVEQMSEMLGIRTKTAYQLLKNYINRDKMGYRLKPDFVSQHFKLILNKNGLKSIRFHDLRHSCASLLYAKEVDLKSIQEWLGHSTINTTANIYTHFDFSKKWLQQMRL